MKFVFPEIDTVFDTEIYKVNTLIIENQRLMLSVLKDIEVQLSGLEGKAVVSDNNKILDFSKNVELISQFFPFEINKKTLISKVCSEIEKEAAADENYLRSAALLSEIESYFYYLSRQFTGNFNFAKINMSSLVKASGIEFDEEYDSLAEKLTEYFGLVYEFDRRKLFITLNLRSFIPDNETELFLDTVIKHGYNLIMLENREYNHLANEQRYIVDSDLCEIK